MKNRRILLTLCVLLLLTVFASAVTQAEVAQDAEAATHDYDSASYQVVDTYDYSDFQIVQIDLGVLSHYSYMLISDGECLVVDPGRDIDVYVEIASSENVQITGVWLSHSHADFVAGHIEFAQSLQVPIRISEKANAGYDPIELKDNDELTLGDAHIQFIETPGHTPDSMCALISSESDPEKPLVLLTGDTLFVGSVGRPDLLGEGMAASTLASMMFDTWTKKLSLLPDDVAILPAHGAGSLCGAHLSDSPLSTIGQERVENPYLQYSSRGQFIAAILEGVPTAPQYFAHNAVLNREGPPVVNWGVEQLPFLVPSTELSDTSQYYLIDIRDADAYAEGHVPNSVNIALRGRIETWTGVMVPWGSNAVVIGIEEEMREAVHRLHRVGYAPSCLNIDDWKEAGLPLIPNEMIRPNELYAAMRTTESPVVVDVRRPTEWEASRIGTVVNIPLDVLERDSIKLDRSQQIVAVCNSAYRSSLAVGVLERLGFPNVSSMEGGGDAWLEAGLPFEGSHPIDAGIHGSIRLPDRISASELKRLMMDLPGSYDILDIRPASHFADYRLPGSFNVTVDDLLSLPEYQAGHKPLIIVCRDGSISAVAAGILAQKSDRNIKILYGGLSAYWDELGGGSNLSAPGSVPSSPAPRTPVSPPTRSTPQPRRSAGC
jgi:hydroxyacylglutathione hydrolase